MTDMRNWADAASGYPGRTYRFFKFGYGLSYSTYSYKFKTKAGSSSLFLNIKSLGEACQTVIGFEKISLNAGEESQVEFVLSPCEHFSHAMEDGRKVLDKGGSYFLVVGEEELWIEKPIGDQNEQRLSLVDSLSTFHVGLLLSTDRFGDRRTFAVRIAGVW
ncbi:hypothetical protein HPP92_015727 [Vanilla planifolia]|uniref:Fibronectin type III-like domain-containing protein n=1 Tax=Vanilla planifolia TaxID=51239 RepID=A0A835QAR5_VANPL|nr:hypothetical protein HPP92_016341 [Vanilla planifolia]KAG0471181.1 hypothetical protein HPP92_015727 [Vanilla planifolia]